MKKFKCLLFILFSAVLFYSCTLVTEPARIYNNNAAPPELIGYNFNQLSPGQHVDGTIKITFDPKNLNSNDLLVKIYIDSVLYDYFSNLPHTAKINTRNYSEGIHNIYFYVYEKDSNIGLLNMTNAPSRVYGNYLYFDRTPPDKVNLTVAAENSGVKDLTWTKSSSVDFYAYLIYKSVNGLPYLPIDTVYDKNIISFKDSADSDLLGVNFKYKVAVTTDYKFTFKTESSTAECELGKPIRYNFSKYNSGPYLNDKMSRLYYIVDEKLVDFSTADLTNSREIDLSGLMISPSDYISLCFNFSKSRIYLYNNVGYKLWIINSADLSVIKKLTLPEGGDNLYVWDNSRIFFSSYNGFVIINTDYNSVLNKTDKLYAAAIPAIVTQDSARMVLIDKNSNGWCFDVMDISSNSFNILYTVNINDYYQVIKRAGNKLYCDGKSIYDANNLSLLGTLNISDYIDSFAVTDGFIAIARLHQYNLPGNNFVSCQKVSLYNDNSNKIIQWFVNANNTLAVDKENVYTGPSINGTGPADVLGYSLKYGQ